MNNLTRKHAHTHTHTHTHMHGAPVWRHHPVRSGGGGGRLGVCRPESGSTRTDVSLAVWLPTGLIDQYADSLSLSRSPLALPSLSPPLLPPSSPLFYFLSSSSVSSFLPPDCSASHFPPRSAEWPPPNTTDPTQNPSPPLHHPSPLTRHPLLLYLSFTAHHSRSPLFSSTQAYKCTGCPGGGGYVFNTHGLQPPDLKAPSATMQID